MAKNGKPKRPRTTSSAAAWIRFDERYRQWKAKYQKKETLIKKYQTHY